VREADAGAKKAANLIADEVIAAARQNVGWHWKDAVSLCKSQRTPYIRVVSAEWVLIAPGT